MYLAGHTLLVTMIRDAEYWKVKLHLTPHPEGGYFRETYRAGAVSLRAHLPKGFSGDRAYSTAIYYLLSNKDLSKLHRIKSDEMWHYYDGGGLNIFVIDESGNLSEQKLGLNPDEGQAPQILVEAGKWFGATVTNPDSFCLCGCTVSPGFHFEDFEIGERKKLLESFPKHRTVIEQLTNAQ